jgi:hypothetical protein
MFANGGKPKFRFVPSRVLGVAAGLALLLHAPAVLAFSEDVCFPSGGGAPFTCSPLPAVCQPVGTTSPACLAAALANFVGENMGLENIGAKRSMIHADCVNLLAQATGFSTDDANWISAYGEVPDYGQFGPTDMTGQPLDGGAYQTAELNGFERTSFTTGGSLYHFIPLYNGGSATPPPGIDGLQPSTQSASTEYFVTHVRDWAMAESGTSPPICTGGLTNQSDGGDYATGTGCFAQNGQPAQIDWTWALLGFATKTYTYDTGLQVIDTTDGGVVVSSDFDTAVGSGATRVADARLGIYLHMLADRVSHHACTDTSSMAGPSSSGPVIWSESETSSIYCQQDYHSLFHMWETGVDFTGVPSANRTTEAALDLLYDELVAFATARNTVRAGASDAATKSALVSAMLAALQTQAADARITALAKVACDNGYQPFPGAPACTSPGADGGAGSSSSTTSSSSGGTMGGGGCSLSTVDGPLPVAGGAAWLAMLVALRRRARRARRA